MGTSMTAVGLQGYSLALGQQGASLSAQSAQLQGQAADFQAQGVAAGDTFQAEKLDNAATYGELKAAQTGGQMSLQLNQTLGNIDAVRAAAGTDPTSPTGAAIRDQQEDIGTTQRTTTVNSIVAQANQDTADAAYQRKAASDALLAGNMSLEAGNINADAAIDKGNASLFSGIAGFFKGGK